MTIYGDYFNQDTRGLLTVCKLADVDYKFVLVDTLKKQNFNEHYIRLNPNSSVPTIADKNKNTIVLSSI